MDVLDIAVGLASGLLGVFTFLTGITSARQLRSGTAGRLIISARRRFRLWLVLGLSVPVFLVSMSITWARGMNGDDTGGTQFLLLLIGAAALSYYVVRLRAWLPWLAFFSACTLALGGLGLLFGSISAGEEAEGLSAGLVIGSSVGLLGLVFPRNLTSPVTANRSDYAGPPAPEAPSEERTTQEREILQLARQHEGELTVGDVAINTSLSLDEARQVLDQLAFRSFCSKQVIPNGAVLYHFPDFRPR